jgi:hypothetical protein
MVEIRRFDVPDSAGEAKDKAAEDDKYRLIYSKSKVYVNPTAYARDNIPGFVALVKRETFNPIYLLAWIPETLLNEKGASEWDKFVKVEEQSVSEEDDGMATPISSLTRTKIRVQILFSLISLVKGQSPTHSPYLSHPYILSLCILLPFRLGTALLELT